MMKKIFNLLFKIPFGIIVFLFFPVYLVIKIFYPINILKDLQINFWWKVVLRKLSLLIILLFIVYPTWAVGYSLSQDLILQKLGLTKDEIFISGTGSMYPTFPKGEGKNPKEQSKEIVSSPGMFPYPNGLVINGNRYFGYKLQRGDIVVVENDEIRQMTESTYGEPSGWVKRLIALPGDTIELREGLVYLNKVPQKEKYTASPRSTFGQNFLPECKEIKVPDDSIFLLGDNRKASGDSREIGFISISSVNHVLPLVSQIGLLDKNWRNTEQDLEDSSKIKLDKNKYVELLNTKRKASGKKLLKYNSKLELSAAKRGTSMLQYDDFSYEATISGYTMARSLRESGYSNIVWGEIPTQGYYEADELVENQFEFPKSKEFLLSADFDDIGISSVEGSLNGCPAQVIVMHFGGYVPPNYKSSDIDSWKLQLSNLKEIQASWRELTTYNDFYSRHKDEIDRINFIIETRIINTSQIIEVMVANRWFTDSEKFLITNDEVLSKEQSELANKINSYN